MFKNILLPVDLGHEASWSKAVEVAKGLGGKVHVLGVVPDFGEAMVAAYFPADFSKKAAEGLKARLDAFAAEHVAGATTHVGHGHVAEAILAVASAVGADLIVMASHPPDELRSLFVGSQAERVVRHSPIPVLVVR